MVMATVREESGEFHVAVVGPSTRPELLVYWLHQFELAYLGHILVWLGLTLTSWKYQREWDFTQQTWLSMSNLLLFLMPPQLTHVCASKLTQVYWVKVYRL